MLRIYTHGTVGGFGDHLNARLNQQADTSYGEIGERPKPESVWFRVPDACNRLHAPRRGGAAAGLLSLPGRCRVRWAKGVQVEHGHVEHVAEDQRMRIRCEVKERAAPTKESSQKVLSEGRRQRRGARAQHCATCCKELVHKMGQMQIKA